MDTDKPPCTREDLEGYVMQSLAATLDEGGYADDVIDRCEIDYSKVDEYYCKNCMDFWPVGEPWTEAARQTAYQLALDHLNVAEVAA